MDIENINEVIGARIRTLRKNNQESQQDLAKILSTTQNNISKIEKGINALTLDHLLSLGKHYNVSLDYLCTGVVGINLLDTLNKYINYKICPTYGIADDKYSHRIPTFTINKLYYEYLSQVAEANNNKKMPSDIRQAWKKRAETKFNDEISESTLSKDISFIPLNQEILSENRDIIKLIEKHIYEQ